MFNPSLLSSKTIYWRTPTDFFDKLNAEFGFTRDVCATPENTQLSNYYTEEQDGLAQDWAPQVCWMNPPYGRVIGAWIKKAHDESKRGATVVCLLPARTDTRWFHDYILGKAEVRFVKGRLKFGGCKVSAPFPNMVVVFRP